MDVLMSALLMARLALAAVFMLAGLAKVFDRTGSRQAIVAFGMPEWLAAPMGLGLPLVEIAVSVALVPTTSARLGALGALVLLGLFVAGVINVMISGREAECHCFGQLHSSRVGWSTLCRNIGLAMVAGFVIAGERRGFVPSYEMWISALSRVEVLVLFAAVIVLAIVTAAGWFMMNLLRQHGRLLVRLDTLEEQLAERGIIAHRSTAGSSDGLSVGVPAPAFSLPDLHGATTTLGDLLAAELPLLLVFGHPGCTPCVAMLPEIGTWQSAHRGALSIALISQGNTGDNRAAVVNHGIERVLLQRDREVADSYEAYATPSAVLVSREGTIASPVGQGAAAIRVIVRSVTAGAPSDLLGDTGENLNGIAHSARPLPWGVAKGTSMSPVGLDAY